MTKVTGSNISNIQCIMFQNKCPGGKRGERSLLRSKPSSAPKKLGVVGAYSAAGVAVSSVATSPPPFSSAPSTGAVSSFLNIELIYYG